MGKFTADLVIREIGYERFMVVEPFTWKSRSLVVLVDAGFVTDLASVPQLFRTLVPKVGYWSQAAVVHDLLYHRHRAGMDVDVTRLQADRALREGARAKAIHYHVPTHKRREWQIYHFVRAFGQLSWETPDERKIRLEAEANDADFY